LASTRGCIQARARRKVSVKPVVDLETVINALESQIHSDEKFWGALLEGLDNFGGDDKILLCFLITYIGDNETAKMLFGQLQGLDGLLAKKEARVRKQLDAFISDRRGKRFDFHHKFLPTKKCRPAFAQGILDFRAFASEIKQEQNSLTAHLDSFDRFDDLFHLLYDRRIKYLDKALHVFDFMETLYRAGILLREPERMYLKERMSDGTGLGPIGNGLSSFYLGRKLAYRVKAIKAAYAKHYGITNENVPTKVEQLGIGLQKRVFSSFQGYDEGKLVFVLETLLCICDFLSSR